MSKDKQKHISHERKLELVQYKSFLEDARIKQETVISYHVLVIGVLAALIFFISKDFFVTGTYKDLFFYSFVLSAVFSLMMSIFSSVWSNYVFSKIINIVDFSLESNADLDTEIKHYTDKGNPFINFLNKMSCAFCIISLVSLWFFIISF